MTRHATAEWDAFPVPGRHPPPPFKPSVNSHRREDEPGKKMPITATACFDTGATSLAVQKTPDLTSRKKRRRGRNNA